MAQEHEPMPPEIPDPDVVYTPEEKQRMNAKARSAAVKEWREDPNRRDPKRTQQRMDEAVHGLRVRMGLERE